jgi:hypothetical protein
MFKLVVIHRIPGLTDAQCLKKLKDITTSRYRKHWTYHLFHHYEQLNLISFPLRKKGFLLLAWHGPDDQYLLTKLSSPRGFVVGQVDVEDNSKLWKDIRYCAYEWGVAADLLNLVDKRDLNRYLDTMNTYTKSIYDNFQELLVPIAEKLS